MPRLLTSGYGIDLGTANTVVCHPRRGVVLDEPSLMVIRATGDGRRPLLMGKAARELTGRMPAGLTAIRPLRDGVIVDLESARSFIVEILRHVARRFWDRLRTRAVIGVPAGATGLERRALVEAAEEAGINRVTLIPEPIAGALGAGLDPLSSRPRMVIDVGGGTAEVTAFCYGAVVTSRSCRVAGDEMTLALYQYLRQVHSIVVGELTVEEIKIRAGQNGNGSLVVEGGDTATGRARLLTLPADEVAEAVRPTASAIIQTLAACLDDLPPQAIGDIMQDGVVLFGGGSLTRGFDRLLEEAMGFPVRLSARPLTCVAEGAARCLERPDIVRAFGGYGPALPWR
jgi:rod shape-determining protein MreB